MKKIRKAVIAAAGLGTRFLPITKAVPKSMLPVVDTPTLDYIINEACAADLEEVILIVGHNAEVIERHFAPDKELENRLRADGKEEILRTLERIASRVKVRFVVQKEMNGIAGALLCAEEAIGNEPFALLLGDEILYAGEGEKTCVRRLCEVYEQTGKTVIAAMRVAGEDISKYGNLGISKDGDVKEVYGLKEKPALSEKLSDYAVIGRYAVDSCVFDEIRALKMHGSELVLTEAFTNMAAKGKIAATEFEGRRYDVGDRLGYVRANLEFALRDEHIGAAMRQIVSEIGKDL